MEIKVVVTAQEIMDGGAWEKFCELNGLNPWCVSEGLMDSDEQFTLSPTEMNIIGLDGAKIPDQLPLAWETPCEERMVSTINAVIAYLKAEKG